MIPLYSDFPLRMLQEKRNRAEACKKTAFAQYSKARRAKELIRAQLESWKRITKALGKVSDPFQIAELQTLLMRFPPEDELRGQVKEAVDEAERVHVEYRKSHLAYQNIATKVSDRYAFTLWVDRIYGNALSVILREFGNIELICKYDKAKGKLNVYFGGHKEPGGAGHAHWVINKRGIIAYRRDPEKWCRAA